MHFRRTVTAMAAAMIAATSLAATVTADEHEPTITGTEWSLTAISSGAVTASVPTSVGATLTLADGASGSAGCNTFAGDYSLDGSDLSFGPLATTKIACAGPGQEVEDAYLPALGQVASWSIDGEGALRLADGDGNEVLAFAAPPAGIEGVSWILREQAVDGGGGPIAEGVLVTLRLDDGTASGTGGCNRYSGPYELDGSSLTLGPIGSTLAACPGPAGDVESAYLANLQAVTAWASDRTTLTLSDADGEPLLRYEARGEATIVGSWVASGINNGRDAVVSSAETPNVTAVFGPDGELTGTDGCNDYFGTYEIDGDGITIGPLGQTQKACLDEAVTETAASYIAALGNATTWSITDVGNLELRDAEGGLQVGYVPAEG